MIIVPDHIEALLFDCDGTLVDSMPLHMKAWEEAFTANEARYEHEFLFSLKGMREVDVVEAYNRQFGTALDAVKIVGYKNNLYEKKIDQVPAIDLVVDMARRFRGKLPMAVVSGSPADTVHRQLKNIGIFDWFETILTADDPYQPKPEPGIFLEAAKRVGIPPEKCQVFEDGDAGLEAARKAGMLPTDVRPFLGDSA